MAKKMKRVLSLVLIFSLLMSMLSISAYATDGTGEGQPAAPLNQQQVENAGGSKTSDEGLVTISKTLEGTDIENVFDITLTVDTSEDIETLMEAQSAAVVLVMDVSFSMVFTGNRVEKAGGGLETQWAMAERAAESFIDEFAADAASHPSAARKLAVVSFNTDARTVSGWTDCKTSNAASTLKTAIETEANTVFGAPDNGGTDCRDGSYTQTAKNDYYNNRQAKIYTNIEGGLQLANNLLEQSDVAGMNKYIILLTDGFPTTYMKTANDTDTSEIEGWNPRMDSHSASPNAARGYFHDALTNVDCEFGTSYSDKGAMFTQDKAASIRDDGTSIFTIGINIEGQKISDYVRNGATTGGIKFSVVDCYTPGNNGHPAGFSPEYNAKGQILPSSIGSDFDSHYVIGKCGNNVGESYYKTWLSQRVSSNNYYWDGNDTNALNAAFAKIREEIEIINRTSIEASWVATDPMMADVEGKVEFLNFYDKGVLVDGDLEKSKGHDNTASLASVNRIETINWDLKASKRENIGDAQNPLYRYSLKYRVRLKNEVTGRDAFVEGNNYDTNGVTSLKYRENLNGVLGEEKNVDFPIPAVKGYLGELSFQKTADGEPVNGAEFKLSHNDDCSVCAAMDVDVKIDDMTAVSSGTVEGEAGQTPAGMVSFENIPSGHEYTLSETKAPEGYEPTADRQVVVAYDVTTVDGTSDFTAIDNKPLNSLVITKDVNLKTDGDKNTEKEEELISAATYIIKVEKVGDDDWSRTVTLPMDKDGQKVWSAKLEGLTSGEYTVTELGGNVLDGYNYSQTIKVNDIIIKDKKETETESVTVSLADGMTGQADVVNNYEYEPKMIPVIAYKVWDDADNQDGKRPDSVRFELSVGGVVLEEKDGPQKDVTDSCTMEVTDPATKEQVQKIDPNKFSVTFEYDANQYPGTPSVREVGYTVNGTYYPFTDQVTAVPGYDEPAVNGLTITNKHVPETIDIPVTKKWVDAADQDGIRPANVKINLYADKVLVDSAEVSSSYTFKDLPKYKAGKEIAYTIDELEVPNGYTKKVDGFTVTNTHKPAEQTVTVTKVWDDANNQDGKRPESITVKLYADGVEVDSHVLTGEGNNWSYTFTGLPMYKEGKKIVYTVDEEVVPADYTKDIDGNVITNSHTPETTDVKVSEVWASKKMKDSVTIRLLADGTEVDNIVLTAENEWTHTFTDLPKYSEGKMISYTVTEDPLGSFWSAKIEETADGWVVTNSYYVPSPPTIDVSVNKVWDDADDADGLRPESITVQLLRNGKVYAEEELSEGNWSTTWTDLYANDTWTVKEVNVPEGYTSSVSGSGTSFTITNTHTPETPVITPEEPTPPTGGKDPEDPLHGLDDGDVPQDYMEVGDPDVPKTGDTTNVMLWLTVAFLSAAALLGMRFAERKIK